MTGGAHATLVVDDFSEDVVVQAGFPASTPDSVTETTTLTTSSSLFDTRDITLTANLASPIDGSITGVGADQGFKFNSTGASGSVELAYSQANGSSVDFLGNDILSITVTNFDFPGGEPKIITVTVADTDSSSTISQTVNTIVSPSSPLPVNFPLGGVSGLDLSQVTRVTVTLDLPDGSDITFDDFVVIPEPGSIALLGLAGGLLMSSPRRSRA